MTIFHKCTFNGIKMNHLSTTISVGRKAVTVEFPFKNYTDYYDLGLRARTFSETFIFNDENAHVSVNELMEVLESPGPYEYVHSLLGSMLVKVDGSGVEFRLQEGKINSWIVSIAMERTGEAQPSTILSPSSKVSIKAVQARESTKQALVEGYSAEKLTFVEIMKSNLDRVKQVSSSIRKINSGIATKLNMIETLTAELNKIEENIDTLLATPDTVASVITGVILAGSGLLKQATKSNPALSPVKSVRDAARRNERILGAAASSLSNPTEAESSGTQSSSPGADRASSAGILSEGSPSSVLDQSVVEYSNFTVDKSEIPLNSTPQRAQELKNAEVLELTVKSAGLIGMCENTVEVAWGSYDQVEATIKNIDKLTEEVLASPHTNDKLFQDIVTLQSSAKEYLRTVAGDLPRSRTIRIQRTLPSEIIAFALWGTIDYTERIFDRNPVSHPGKIAAGTELEILSDY